MDKTTFSSPVEAPGTDIQAHEQRLVDTIQAGFADLAKRNEVHTERVLEALKPNSPATDKETTFWNVYKTLSEEYDREFHKKYGTDLDTSLIFAGLFSAVSSAFIIQVQPELRQDPNEVTQKLLRVLIHNTNQSLFSGIDMTEPNSGAPTTVVIAQSLLYASLSSALVAALLAVLGKQWLMHYDGADRGTLAERGLERQRKYDSLQRWKFTLVIEMVPLLLQLALLLSSIAISVYMSTISRPITIILIALASLGSLVYISQLVSAAAYPDSPFQTPLAGVLRKVVLRVWDTLPPPPPFLGQFRQGLLDTWIAIQNFLQPEFLPLPLFFHKSTPSNDEDPYLPAQTPLSTAPFPEASPEASAVLWLLETSTNPDIIYAAADIAVDLQWPLHADLNLALDRLRDTFWASFIESPGGWWQDVRVRNTAAQHAIVCGQAYGTMNIGHDRQLIRFYQSLSPTMAEGTESLQLAQLHSVFNTLKGDTGCFHGVRTQSAMLWVLHVLPHTARNTYLLPFFSEFKEMIEYASASQTHLTKQNYANCLFFMNVMLGFKPHGGDLAWKDKSIAIEFLIKELFNNLSKSLDKNSIDLTMAKDITTVMGQMADMADYVNLDPVEVRSCIYNFCATMAQIDGWVDVVMSALAFGGLVHVSAPLHNVSWVYAAFQAHLQNDGAEKAWDATTEERVYRLLEVLADATDLTVPSERDLRLILRALFTKGRCSTQALKVLCGAESWFVNEHFQPIMQEYDVWSRMGAVAATEEFNDPWAYIQIGVKLSNVADWAPYIHRNLLHWITVYSRVLPMSQNISVYRGVLERIWGMKYRGPYQLMYPEETLAWPLIALSNCWEGFDFSGKQTLRDFYLLIKCTISTAFKSQHIYSLADLIISPEFRAAFYSSLGDALIQAARNAEDMIASGHTQIAHQRDLDGSPQNKTPVLHLAARIVDEMGQSLKYESEGEQVDRGEAQAEKYWDCLRAHFQQQADELEALWPADYA